MPTRSALPLRSLLDVRARVEAFEAPIADSFNIPLPELAERVYELAASTVRVAAAGPYEEAVKVLTQMRRRAEVVPFEWGSQSEPGRLWSPNAFLESVTGELEVGEALDLGCGVGRDAVFLASMGWSVWAVDRLPDALLRVGLLASRYPDLAGRVRWSVCDLRRAFPETGLVDLVTMLFYLDRAALGLAIERLRPSGSLVLETFTEVHRDRFGKPHSPDSALRLGEAEGLASGLTVVDCSEDWRAEGRHTARLLARRE